jgi:hypothetical protein
MDGAVMRWTLSSRGDAGARAIADRHYNRRNPGTPSFTPPGRPLVLRCARALWVTIYNRPEYVDHAWPGVWLNSTFRNEGAGLSSELIIEACAATRAAWGELPSVVSRVPMAPVSMITFVDPSKVRAKRDPGRCYRRAGFIEIGETKGGHGRSPLLVFGLLPDKFPPPSPALGSQLDLTEAA